MKKGFQLLIFILVLNCSVGIAQEYPNEWINYSQKYFKISTAEGGIYRISYDDLISAGVPITTIDPKKIQIYHRGMEHAIYVKDQNLGSFDSNDYIEFYGKKNDGTLDEELYVTPEAQPHKYHNFYSDTTAYFLTWSLSQDGKRIRTFKENNILNLPAEPYQLNEELKLETNEYAAGLIYHYQGDKNNTTYLSAFDYAEGWTGTGFNKGESRDITFSNLENIIPSGPKPILEVLITGGNNLSHNVSILVGPDAGNQRPLTDVNFNYWYDTLITKSLEWTDIFNGTMTCRVSIPDFGVADRVSISYAKLIFAEEWDQQLSEQKKYHAKPTNSNRSYLEILNVPLGAKLYDISDEENIVDIGYNVIATGINAVIENDANGRKLLLTSSRISRPKIEAVTMRDIDPTNTDFIIVTHKSLRLPTDNYSDVPKAYASYRASSLGGNYDTLLVNIDQLYNMFSYGEYTSLALYRFCRYMAENGDPSYLFIMGKGLSGYNLKSDDGSRNMSQDLIPTSGYPGSDILFTAGLNGTTHESGIPIGRISASTPNVLDAYLEKVKEMEAIPYNALWRKELVHLSGGENNSRQQTLRTYVNGFKAIAEGEMLGGKVETYGKKTNEPTELFNISEQVNAGKLLVTFFGHSVGSTSDIDIGYVHIPAYGYNNKGKYPMMIVNGCLAGDMYNTGYGYAEDWIGTPEKGAIGFIAHTNFGFQDKLNKYTSLFYKVAFTDSIFMKKGVGDIQKEVGKRFDIGFYKEIGIAQIQQMALQGDPSISLFGPTKPDYEINSDNVFAKSIDGEPIDASSEAFNLGIIVRNFGATHRDSLKVSIKRTLENGTVHYLDTMLYKPVFYQDTLYYPIETLGFEGSGVNQFTITLDPAYEVDELSETNNQATKQYKIARGGTSNIFPSNYSIINKKETKLVAQSQDLLMDERTYLFELDTTELFELPIQQTSVQGRTLAKWTVDLFEGLPDKDTLVFYWRTKFAVPRPPKEDDIWETTSFTYINKGNPGWAMTHYQQFNGTEKENVLINPEDWKWEFEQFETKISVKTFGSSHPSEDYYNVELWLNNTSYIFETETSDSVSRLCKPNSINLVAFNKSSTAPYLALGRPFILDRTNCGRVPQVINNMLNSEIENDPDYNIEKYIDAVDDGDYVLLFSIGNVTYQNWPASTIAKLAEIGVNATDIQSLSEGESLIILGKKGDNPGSATIVKADYSNPTPAIEQKIMLDQPIIGRPTVGVIRSPRIGPASSWSKFYQKTKLSEVPTTDDYSFNIYGIDNSNNEILLSDYENIKISNEDSLDIQSIEPSTYPFIRLEMNLSDEVNLTPPQLSNWIVKFDGVPEGVLSFKEGQKIEGNEKKEGELHEAIFTFENVSDLAFQGSITIEYSLYNKNNRTSHIDTIMIEALNSEESIDVPLFINTMDKSGDNDLKVFANPYLQTERIYNNNYIDLPSHLTVETDNTNPIMEVTVDGEFIMDGDIVSPSPLILLRMKDENDVLYKNDTLGVHLYLNEKNETPSFEPTRISFSSPNLIWTPATPDSDFTVEYRPQNLTDGIYTLRAEAADASGNKSGAERFSVSFEIINESQITNFFPYPNPFSTRTQFVFTLTGSEIPDEIIIQIMTINGTVVREITQDEIGPIKIGNNKTEYAWDGRDEYGDQLANGVYLYKVKIYIDGEEIKSRSTSADKAFKNGIGKMYLLR